MSLREWDRKAQVLKEEVLVLMKLADQRSSDENEKKLLSMQKKLPEIENKLTNSLSFIHSQSQRKGFFTQHEQAILHWAAEYAKKAQSFFFDYTETFNELFWAKLVHTRGESVSAHGAGNFFTGKGRKTANKQQKKLYETRKMLKNKLDQINKRNQVLDQRYNLLAIRKENKAAASPKFVSDASLGMLKKLESQDSGSSGLPFEYLKEEVLKFSKLTTDIQKSNNNQSVGEKNSHMVTRNPIESFDYLKLDEPFEA